MCEIAASFMGANSPLGFYSFSEEFYNPYKNHRVYIIKGGPGTGKSTLMRAVAKRAEELSMATELIYCSSDPSSLDGVIIRDIHTCIMDGTSPHTLEPKFPGAVESIINTGDFWDRRLLWERRDIIRRLTVENSLYHRRSSKYLNAAGVMAEENLRLARSCLREEKVLSFAHRFALREAPRKKGAGQGRIIRRFISGITPEGVVYLDESLRASAYRVIGIKDEYSAVSGLFCRRAGERMVKNGYDVIFCYCPMRPKGDCEHIIIPELSLAVLSLKKEHTSAVEPDRIIHAARFTENQSRELSAKMKYTKKLCSHLLDESIISLKNAKAVHDELEGHYAQAVDFDALSNYGKELIGEIFSL